MEFMDSVNFPQSEAGYSLEFPLGKGSFGLVWYAQILEGDYKGQGVAIKILDLEQYEDGDLQEIRKEITAMADSNHPNIVSYYCSFSVRSEVWLVMPCMRAGCVALVLES